MENDIEKMIESLPKGYISNKTINGKACFSWNRIITKGTTLGSKIRRMEMVFYFRR